MRVQTQNQPAKQLFQKPINQISRNPRYVLSSWVSFGHPCKEEL
jgi:hypothetical protein